MHNNVAFIFLSGPGWNYAQVDLMGVQIEVLSKAGLYQIVTKSALSVPLCAVPDYNVDMPPFTLYGSSANQTKSITQVYTYSNKTTRTHTQERGRENERG